jgi:hypothetical protein
MQLSRRLMNHEEKETSLDIPQKILAQSNNNDPTNKNEAVILELEEQLNSGVCTETRSAAVFQVWKIFIPLGGGDNTGKPLGLYLFFMHRLKHQFHAE